MPSHPPQLQRWGRAWRDLPFYSGTICCGGGNILFSDCPIYPSPPFTQLAISRKVLLGLPHDFFLLKVTCSGLMRWNNGSMINSSNHCHPHSNIRAIESCQFIYPPNAFGGSWSTWEPPMQTRRKHAHSWKCSRQSWNIIIYWAWQQQSLPDLKTPIKPSPTGL